MRRKVVNHLISLVFLFGSVGLFAQEWEPSPADLNGKIATCSGEVSCNESVSLGLENAQDILKEKKVLEIQPKEEHDALLKKLGLETSEYDLVNFTRVYVEKIGGTEEDIPPAVFRAYQKRVGVNVSDRKTDVSRLPAHTFDGQKGPESRDPHRVQVDLEGKTNPRPDQAKIPKGPARSN